MIIKFTQVVDSSHDSENPLEMLATTENGKVVKVDPFVAGIVEQPDKKAKELIGKLYMIDDDCYHKKTDCFLS